MAQKLRLAYAKEGKRINQKGPQLFAENITHDEAQALSNKGFASWFIYCDAENHPNPAERPSPKATEASAPKEDKATKKPGSEKLEEQK